MPRHKQTPEQIMTMRERIMDAAISLFNELEPEEISIRKIAERAGISHMVIYNYFKDRDELVKALILRQEGRIRQKFNEVLLDVNDETILPHLKEILSEYINIAKARPKLFRLLWITPLKTPIRFNHGHVFFEEQIKMMSRLLQDGMERGIFVKRDPELATLTVLSIINSPMFIFHQGRMTGSKIRDQVINETLDIILLYILGK
jgi:AcrR family transcriptional regulator